MGKLSFTNAYFYFSFTYYFMGRALGYALRAGKVC